MSEGKFYLAMVLAAASSPLLGQGPGQEAPPRASGLTFELVDSDHNQAISREEFASALERQGLGDLAQRFSEFDLNSDQRIDQEEFKALQPRLLAASAPAPAHAPLRTIKEKPSLAVTEPKAPTYATSGQSQSLLGEMTVGDMIAKEVINTQGQNLGRVSKVVRAKASRHVGAVLESGGILGIGDHAVVIPLGSLGVQGDHLIWHAAVSRQAMDEADAYQAERYEDITNRSLPLKNF